jgi:hypothetical protein
VDVVVTCFPNSPGGTTGSFNIPCGQTYSIIADDTFTSYPMGIAISPDGTTAYAVLDVNDTLAKINLTASTPTEGAQIRVGNVPHSVVISPDGKTAYVSNEAGRIATQNDFQEYSDGTPVVAEYPTGTTAAGTVSVVDLASFTVTGSITTGHHPTGMAFWGNYLLVSPYVIQKVNEDGTGAGVSEESTFYTQVNMTRTIEQILGLTPMNQNDLIASPMSTIFVDNPPSANFKPWTHVANGVPLIYGVSGYVPPANIALNTGSPAVRHLKAGPAVMALQAAWLQKKAEIFAGKYHMPDSEDVDTVTHYDWYEATGFMVPFPGEKTVRPPSDFNKPAPTTPDSDD